MAYQSSPNEEEKKRRMEAELNRLKEEISRPSKALQNVPSMYQFIPHQIKRPATTMVGKPTTTSSTAVVAEAKPTLIKGFNNAAGPAQPYTVSPMELPPGVSCTSYTTPTPKSSDQGTKRSKNSEKSQQKQKKALRMAGGQIWEDQSLLEWDPDDFRVFIGDLGNDVTDEVLTRGFSKYQSFVKAKVVREKRTNKSKGYGFVSFKDPQDYIRAMREMDGKYLGSRPIKLRKSNWKDRSLDVAKKKQKAKAAAF